MKVTFTPTAWEDYVSWQQQDLASAIRINGLIAEIRRTPFRVSGKGDAQTVEIVQCRYHY